MVKVNSLTSRIVIQFAVILLPLVALLIFETTAEARRAASMSHAVTMRGLAVAAKERYALFLDGAVDAVDTGRLASRASASLREAANSAEQLLAIEPDPSKADRLLVDHLRPGTSLSPSGRRDAARSFWRSARVDRCAFGRIGAEETP